MSGRIHEKVYSISRSFCFPTVTAKLERGAVPRGVAPRSVESVGNDTTRDSICHKTERGAEFFPPSKLGGELARSAGVFGDSVDSVPANLLVFCLWLVVICQNNEESIEMNFARGIGKI